MIEKAQRERTPENNVYPQLIEEIQYYIKCHPTMRIGKGKKIIARDNEISLIKYSENLFGYDENVIIKFIINDNNNIIAKDGNVTYTNFFDIVDLWDLFKRQITTSGAESLLNDTKITLIEFFQSKYK